MLRVVLAGLLLLSFAATAKDLVRNAPLVLARPGLDGRSPPGHCSGGCDEFVLVDGDSPLYAAPRTTTHDPLPSAMCTGDDPRGPTVRRLVMRVVRARGAFVEVETLGPFADPRTHCGLAWDLPAASAVAQHNALAKYRLRLFVPREKLLPVTRRDVRLEAPDGGVLELRAGVAVTPEAAGGSYSGEVGDPEHLDYVESRSGNVPLRFRAPLPPDAVGNSYWAWGGAWDAAAGWWGQDRHLLEDGQYALPEEVVVGGARVAARWRVLQAGRGDAMRTWLVSGNRCARVEVLTRPLPPLPPPEPVTFRQSVAPPEPPPYDPWNPIGIVPCTLHPSHRPWEVDAGARVTWPDGRTAGVALVEDQVPGPARRLADGRHCFRVRLGAAPNYVPLCFAARDVRPVGTRCTSYESFGSGPLYDDAPAR